MCMREGHEAQRNNVSQQVIAHEIMHGYDLRGSSLDADGRLRNWWTVETSRTFSDKVLCLKLAHRRVSGTTEN